MKNVENKINEASKLMTREAEKPKAAEKPKVDEKQYRKVTEVKKKRPTNDAKFLMENFEKGHTQIDIRKTGKHDDILGKTVVTERLEEIPKGGRSRRRQSRRRRKTERRKTRRR